MHQRGKVLPSVLYNPQHVSHAVFELNLFSSSNHFPKSLLQETRMYNVSSETDAFLFIILRQFTNSVFGYFYYICWDEMRHILTFTATEAGHHAEKKCIKQAHCKECCLERFWLTLHISHLMTCFHFHFLYTLSPQPTIWSEKAQGRV